MILDTHLKLKKAVHKTWKWLILARWRLTVSRPRTVCRNWSHKRTSSPQRPEMWLLATSTNSSSLSMCLANSDMLASQSLTGLPWLLFNEENPFFKLLFSTKLFSVFGMLVSRPRSLENSSKLVWRLSREDRRRQQTSWCIILPVLSLKVPWRYRLSH